MARRTRQKTVTRVRKEPPSKPTIGLFRFPRIGRSSHWIIHGAGARTVSHTAHSLSTHVLHHARVHHPITSAHTHTRENWPIERVFFPTRHTRATDRFSSTRETRKERGKLRRGHLAHVPPHLHARWHELSRDFLNSSFFFFLSRIDILEKETANQSGWRKSVAIYSERFYMQ